MKRSPVRAASAAMTIAAAATATAPSGRAQTTALALPAPAAYSAAYRAPTLTQVLPPSGCPTVPQDRPVAVFRFVQGETSDPVDAASFRVAVDGQDRTRGFQVTVAGASGEAWGPLATVTALGVGAHQVTARVCSTRGACGSVATTVSVTPAPPGEGANVPAPRDSRWDRVLDVVLHALRKLLAP